MIFRTDPTDTITVEESTQDSGSRSVRAKINDDISASLHLFQSSTGGYCSESVELHLNERDQTAFEVHVDTHDPIMRGYAPWATLTVGGGYKNVLGDSGHKQSTVFLSAKNLVEIRDELTKEIRRARRAGHIS